LIPLKRVDDQLLERTRSFTVHYKSFGDITELDRRSHLTLIDHVT
jgi:hypothetical protein